MAPKDDDLTEDDLFDDLPEPGRTGELPLDARKPLLPGQQTAVTVAKKKDGSFSRKKTEPMFVKARTAPSPALVPKGPRPSSDEPTRAKAQAPVAPGEGPSAVMDLRGPDAPTSARGAEAALVISDGPDRGTYPLESGEVVIGRGRGCDVVVVRGTVSRAHACISRRDGRYVVTDLGSTTGTFVNGERAVGDVELHDGDEVRFGQLVSTVLGAGLLPSRRLPKGLPAIPAGGPRPAGPIAVPSPTAKLPRPSPTEEREVRRPWLFAGVVLLLVIVACGAALGWVLTRR